MHPALAEFASNTFYEGTLQNGVTASQRTPAGEVFPWPAADVPMMFWVSTHREEHSASGSSFLNRGEASLVERAVTSFLRAGVSPEQIGVITPYQGQCAYVVSHMAVRRGLAATLVVGAGRCGHSHRTPCAESSLPALLPACTDRGVSAQHHVPRHRGGERGRVPGAREGLHHPLLRALQRLDRHRLPQRHPTTQCGAHPCAVRHGDCGQPQGAGQAPAVERTREPLQAVGGAGGGTLERPPPLRHAVPQAQAVLPPPVLRHRGTGGAWRRPRPPSRTY